MSSASRSRLIAVLGIAAAAIVFLALSAASPSPGSLLLANAPATHLSAAARHIKLAPPPSFGCSIQHNCHRRPSHEVTARVVARAQSEEIGGSPATNALDVPVQAYVNKVEHLRALRAARLAAARRLRERNSFVGALNAGKLLDQFD